MCTNHEQCTVSMMTYLIKQLHLVMSFISESKAESIQVPVCGGQLNQLIPHMDHLIVSLLQLEKHQNNFVVLFGV